MTFQLDYASGKPVYVQIVEQVRLAAASGRLRAGDALPPIRALAEQLRINRNTIAKAYAELEGLGILDTQRGKGCFVSGAASPFRKDVRRKLVADVVDTAVVHAHHLQIDRAEFLRIAEERFDALEQKRSRAASE